MGYNSPHISISGISSAPVLNLDNRSSLTDENLWPRQPNKNVKPKQVFAYLIKGAVSKPLFA